MKPYYYPGEGKCPDTPVELPKPLRDLLNPENDQVTTSNYKPDEGLRAACNVALMLGRPLLLTGEPGTGKTQFAYSLACELGLGKPLKFEAKSTSEARDLFYLYDALGRFHQAQISSAHQAQSKGTSSEEASNNILPYLTYQALGLAILRTRKPSDVKDYVPEDWRDTRPCRSVVLIDEIDKSPRDFPNDILNELERMYFRIPELGNVTIEANRNLQPIVVITSNSEKDLPDAFLRRCIYYNIPFPEDRLADIVNAHLGEKYNEKLKVLLEKALDLFKKLRGAPLAKKPATAELLDWMITLCEIDNPLDNPEHVKHTLSALIKTTEDQPKAEKVVDDWEKARKEPQSTEK